jgi:hypothetical protein
MSVIKLLLESLAVASIILTWATTPPSEQLDTLHNGKNHYFGWQYGIHRCDSKQGSDLYLSNLSFRVPIKSQLRT